MKNKEEAIHDYLTLIPTQQYYFYKFLHLFRQRCKYADIFPTIRHGNNYI